MTTGGGDGGGAADGAAGMTDPWVTEQADAVVRLVLDQVPTDRAPHLHPLLAEAVSELGRGMLHTLTGQVQPAGLDAATSRIIAELVARDVPFSRMVTGLRLARGHWTELVLNDQPLSSGTAAQTLTASVAAAGASWAVEQISSYIDARIDDVINGYLLEQQSRMHSRAARQRHVLGALLDGEPVDRPEAELLLGVRLTNHHLALVLSPAQRAAGQDVGQDIAQAGTRLAAAAGIEQPVVQAGRSEETWLWLSRSRPWSDHDIGRLTTHAPDQVRIAVGEPCAGPEGFRRTLRTAVAAHRRASAALADGPVRYADVTVPVLASVDDELARWFTTAEIGPLLGPGRVLSELRRTLLAYLACGQVVTDCAHHLDLHRNTVVYRLQRAAQLLAHPLNERVLEMHTALGLVQTLGDPTQAGDEISPQKTKTSADLW